jgi:N-methylhydantoinase A/oxoprolinase/acetone carboxylase beta subunit
VDIRDYAMVATGGAGPVHACGVAQRLGLKTALIPPAAGVGSAFGLLLAPISFDYARSYVVRLAALDPARLAELFAEMEAEGRQVVEAAGISTGQVEITRMADMRYVGQGHEIRVPVPSGHFGPDSGSQLQTAFEQEYRRIYGRLCEGVPVEAIHWRVTVSGPRPQLRQMQPGQVEAVNAGTALKQKRPALFEVEAGPVETPVYERANLPSGFTAAGPAIIEEAESTTVVPPDWSVRLDDSGNLILSN